MPIHEVERHTWAYAVSLCIGAAMATVVGNLIDDRYIENQAYEQYGSLIQMTVWSVVGMAAILAAPYLGTTLSRIRLAKQQRRPSID